MPRRSAPEDHLRLACANKPLADDNKTIPERRAYLPPPTNDRSHKSHARPLQEFGSPMTLISDLKARQAAKVREIGEALVTAGYDNLDDQATALGFSRAPHGRSSRVLTKAPVLAPLCSIGCFPLRASMPSCAEKSSNIRWRNLPDFMARPEFANEGSSRDLPVRQNPPCNYELQRCSHFVGGDGRPHGDLLPCRLMTARSDRRVVGCG